MEEEEEAKREQSGREEDRREVAALLPSKPWATLITPFSFSHEYWLVTVHEQRGWMLCDEAERDLWVSSGVEQRHWSQLETRLFKNTITLKVIVIRLIVLDNTTRYFSKRRYRICLHKNSKRWINSAMNDTEDSYTCSRQLNKILAYCACMDADSYVLRNWLHEFTACLKLIHALVAF